MSNQTMQAVAALQSLQADAETAAHALRPFALELAGMRSAILRGHPTPPVGAALCQVGAALEAVRASTDALLVVATHDRDQHTTSPAAQHQAADAAGEAT